MELSSTIYVEGSKGPKPFVYDILYADVLLALQDRPKCFEEAREITSTIVRQLLKSSTKPFYSPQQISQTGSEVLKRFNKQAHLRFVAEHPSLQS
jgi:hypothetical protein